MTFWGFIVGLVLGMGFMHLVYTHAFEELGCGVFETSQPQCVALILENLK